MAASEHARTKRAEYLFGTICSVELAGPGASVLHTASEAAFAELARIQRLANPYDADSELSRLNAQAGRGPRAVSEELLALIDIALWMSQHTAGRYDLTVWPLLELWRACEREQRWPTEEQRREAAARVGYARVCIDRPRRAASLTSPGTRLDLSSLIKGYALDCALAAACRFPIERALLNAGGELLAWTRGGETTMVGLADPRDRREMIGLVTLGNQAIATSAQGEAHLMIHGEPVGHLFETTTGLPLQSDLCGVCVVAHSALLADLLSTACFVLGVTEGQALLRSVRAAPGLFLRQDANGLEWIRAGRFPLTQRLELTGIEESRP